MTARVSMLLKSRASLTCCSQPRGRGSLFFNSNRIFSTPSRSDHLWGPLDLLVIGQRALCPGLKRPGREVEQPLLASGTKNFVCHLLLRLPEDDTLVPKHLAVSI